MLQAQQAAIDVIKPGSHWNEPHDATVKVITEGLVKLDLLKGKVSALIKEMAYRDFYMHRAGHWLGMDVHDVGDYKCGGEWRVLEAGMVLTVEPGIYVSPHNKKVDKKWRGIGIRIEDDVVVTKNGCEIITANAPKTVTEIEAWMTLQHPHLPSVMEQAAKTKKANTAKKKATTALPAKVAAKAASARARKKT